MNLESVNLVWDKIAELFRGASNKVMIANIRNGNLPEEDVMYPMI